AFFFTSRRRHTRFSRDWSSDVCSSDLETGDRVDQRGLAGAVRADEAVDLGLLDAHGNILQRLHAAEPAADVFQGQDEPVFSVMARSQLPCASDADRLAMRRHSGAADPMGVLAVPRLLRGPESSTARGPRPRVAVPDSTVVALAILESIDRCQP